MAETTPATPGPGSHRRGRGSARWLVGGLAALLGFAIAVQVRTTQTDADLSAARTSDLVRLLDDLGERSERLEQERSRLQAVRDELASGVDQQRVAREAVQDQLDTLNVLAGTVPVGGPGIALAVIDPDGAVDAAELLDTVQELRDAGAEALEVDGVRWVATSFVVDTDEGLAVDGVAIEAPYDIVAIGDPDTLESALRIPGGVVESLRERGADTLIEQREHVTIDSLKPVGEPQYAQPASP